MRGFPLFKRFCLPQKTTVSRFQSKYFLVLKIKEPARKAEFIAYLHYNVVAIISLWISEMKEKKKTEKNISILLVIMRYNNKGHKNSGIDLPNFIFNRVD